MSHWEASCFTSNRHSDFLHQVFVCSFCPLSKHFQAYFRAGLVARCFRVLGASTFKPMFGLAWLLAPFRAPARGNQMEQKVLQTEQKLMNRSPRTFFKETLACLLASSLACYAACSFSGPRRGKTTVTCQQKFQNPQKTQEKGKKQEKTKRID